MVITGGQATSATPFSGASVTRRRFHAHFAGPQPPARASYDNHWWLNRQCHIPIPLQIPWVTSQGSLSPCTKPETTQAKPSFAAHPKPREARSKARQCCLGASCYSARQIGLSFSSYNSSPPPRAGIRHDLLWPRRFLEVTRYAPAHSPLCISA